MTYYNDYNHFINAVFMFIRQHQLDGAEYDVEGFMKIQQMRRIWSEFCPDCYTWDLKNNSLLAYEEETENWMIEQTKIDVINEKRDKYHEH